MAKLYFKYGTMNSGKSAILLQSAFNYEQKGMKVLVLKPKIDTKGEDYIVSRVGLKRKVNHLIERDEDLYKELVGRINNISCIFVDEAQFLSENQVEDLLHIAVEDDVPVICYGLRTDFRTEGFTGSTRLLQIAHELEELKTICDCGRKAIFNVRKVDGKFSYSGEQVAIDGKEEVTYDSFCPKCYYEKLKVYNRIKKSIKK